ncbi:retrovirus-related pol polyprotein from transposon TNT 1-94 [Tanacetum coccineum]|uniref:Retrovirus-related pol polyprotein from transposon TNT 1-94 n=1 Tax=Tanacetum coccineum TaxID=301880 RepID=A0ABQ5DY83_9ASTR
MVSLLLWRVGKHTYLSEVGKKGFGLLGLSRVTGSSLEVILGEERLSDDDSAIMDSFRTGLFEIAIALVLLQNMGAGVTTDGMGKGGFGIGIVFCIEVFFSLLSSRVEDSSLVAWRLHAVATASVQYCFEKTDPESIVLAASMRVLFFYFSNTILFSTIVSSELFDFGVILIFNSFNEGHDSFSSSALASKAVTVKNKGLIAEAYEWDEEEVSLDDNEMVEVKVLMALAEENDAISKEGARNGVTINEPSSAPAKGNKISSASKVNSAPTGKLKSMKIEDDPPLAIVMKELNNLKLQISKNQSSYFRNNQPQQCDIRKPIWYLDSGCSRHMTGVKSYLHKYVERPRPKVVFGDDSTCTTEGYGSINQLCDAKYIIQFDEKRGTIFNSNKEVVMIAPRVRDVYVLDMTSSAQESCFFAKASENLNWLWHKRLAHLNFKTINKLAKQNLVIGLPSLVYSKDKPCSSCEKGKHHRASFKTKQTSSIKKCLHLLHMDLFGPVTPRSINHEKYTLVIVDEYSRYTWVYFLKKKSQAPETIMSFIKRVENQNDIKVKQLRTDNGTEFRNSILVNFCDEKGISQNFSSPYTPKQNGVAERKNRTLIEAARTMLSGSVFSKQYWTEAVATACYTQNRSTIVKRHLKTPYEIFRKRIPNINFLYVFGCPVYIHNHKDHLGKFDEKVDDGYLLGYLLVSKAFKVFNTRRQQTEETYHITFDESPDAIKFSKPSVDNINITENERYPPDEYLHPYKPSQSDDHSEHSNHTNDEQIIDNLPNTKDIQISKHASSPIVEYTLVHNTIPIPNPSLSISSMVTPAPQDIWYYDEHIDPVNIIGNPGAGMLIRAMAKELGATSTHGCLFIDFLSEEELKRSLKHYSIQDGLMPYNMN